VRRRLAFPNRSRLTPKALTSQARFRPLGLPTIRVKASIKIGSEVVRRPNDTAGKLQAGSRAKAKRRVACRD